MFEPGVTFMDGLDKPLDRVKESFTLRFLSVLKSLCRIRNSEHVLFTFLFTV